MNNIVNLSLFKRNQDFINEEILTTIIIYLWDNTEPIQNNYLLYIY